MAERIAQAEKIEDFEILDPAPRRKTTGKCKGVSFDFDSDSDFDVTSTSNHESDSENDSVWGPESEAYAVIRIPTTKNTTSESLKQAAKGKCVEATNGDCTPNTTFLSQEQTQNLGHQKFCAQFFSSPCQDSRMVDEPFLTKCCRQLIKAKKVESETPNKSYCSNKICSELIQPDNNEEYSSCKECKAVNPYSEKAQTQVKDDWYGVKRLESCYHGEWRWRKGLHQCQVCFRHQHQYIFECILCYFHACYQCRRNKF